MQNSHHDGVNHDGDGSPDEGGFMLVENRTIARLDDFNSSFVVSVDPKRPQARSGSSSDSTRKSDTERVKRRKAPTTKTSKDTTEEEDLIMLESLDTSGETTMSKKKRGKKKKSSSGEEPKKQKKKKKSRKKAEQPTITLDPLKSPISAVTLASDLLAIDDAIETAKRLNHASSSDSGDEVLSVGTIERESMHEVELGDDVFSSSEQDEGGERKEEIQEADWVKFSDNREAAHSSSESLEFVPRTRDYTAHYSNSLYQSSLSNSGLMQHSSSLSNSGLMRHSGSLHSSGLGPQQQSLLHLSASMNNSGLMQHSSSLNQSGSMQFSSQSISVFQDELHGSNISSDSMAQLIVDECDTAKIGVAESLEKRKKKRRKHKRARRAVSSSAASAGLLDGSTQQLAAKPTPKRQPNRTKAKPTKPTGPVRHDMPPKKKATLNSPKPTNSVSRKTIPSSPKPSPLSPKQVPPPKPFPVLLSPVETANAHNRLPVHPRFAKRTDGATNLGGRKLPEKDAAMASVRQSGNALAVPYGASHPTPERQKKQPLQVRPSAPYEPSPPTPNKQRIPVEALLLPQVEPLIDAERGTNPSDNEGKTGDSRPTQAKKLSLKRLYLTRPCLAISIVNAAVVLIMVVGATILVTALLLGGSFGGEGDDDNQQDSHSANSTTFLRP